MTLTAENRDIIVIGGGGHARVVAETNILLGRNVVGHVALNDAKDERLGRYLGADDVLLELLEEKYQFVCGMGGVTSAALMAREKACAQVPLGRFQAVLHPSAQVSVSADIERGAFVGPLAIVGPNAHVGPHVLVNSGAIIEHDCVVGDNTHCATGARLAGTVKIGKNCLIGAGTVIRQNVTVGDRVVIGAGSVVLNDVQSRVTVVGNPARRLDER